jgi:hypothetical protein
MCPLVPLQEVNCMNLLRRRQEGGHLVQPIQAGLTRLYTETISCNTSLLQNNKPSFYLAFLRHVTFSFSNLNDSKFVLILKESWKWGNGIFVEEK